MIRFPLHVPCLGLCLALLLLGPRPACADDAVAVDLAWTTTPEFSYPTREIELTATPPDGVKPLEGEKAVRYGRVEVAGKRHVLLAVQEGEPPQLWLDEDFDGDLLDQTPVRLVVPDEEQVRRATVSVRHPEEGKDAELALPFELTLPAGPFDKLEHATLCVRAHREGDVVLGERLRRVVLIDGDVDLAYADPEHDRLGLDIDGDLRVSQVTDSLDQVGLSRAFHVGGRAMTAEVARDAGARLVIQRLAQPVAPRSPPWKPARTPPAREKNELKPGAFKAAREAYEAYLEKPHPRALNPLLQQRLDALRDAGTKKALSYLQRIYKDAKRVDVQAALVRAMGSGHFAEHGERIARIAKAAKDHRVVIAAVEAMHAAGYAKRDKVCIGLLNDAEKPPLVDALVTHLGYVRTEAALKALERRLRQEESPARISVLYKALRHYGSEPPLVAQTTAAMSSVRPRLKALGLRDALRLGYPGTVTCALKGALDCVAAPDGRPDPELVGAVIEVLGRSDFSPGVSHALVVAKCARPAQRERLVALLSARRDVGAAERMLVGLEREKDARVVDVRVRVLGAMRHAPAVDGVLAAAKRMAKDEIVQEAAIGTLARIGFEDPRVVPFFLAQLSTDRPWDWRLGVVDEAALHGGRGATPVLFAALKDEDRRVRIAAVQGLGRLRLKAAIPPLLELLAVEETKRVRDGVAHTLFLTTGQYFYDDLAVWKAWWAEKGATFEVPADVPALPESKEEGRYATTFYGVPVSSERIVFVLDQSGSMAAPHIGPKGEIEGRTQLERAVEEVTGVLDKLADGARVNLIGFETAIHPWRPRMAKLSPLTRKELKKWLAKLEPENGTNLWDGLEMALKTDDVDAIYLLSDGAPNGGRYRSAKDILREALKLNKRRRVAIHCVSLSRESPLLKQLAEANSGIYARR